MYQKQIVINEEDTAWHTPGPADDGSNCINAVNPFALSYLRVAQRKYDIGDLSGAWIECRLGLALEEIQQLRELYNTLSKTLGRQMVSC